MNNYIYDYLNAFFTFNGMLGFVAGVFIALFIVWCEDKRCHTNKLRSIRLIAITWSLMFLFIGYNTVQGERNAVVAQDLSKQVTSCNNQFFAALKSRTELTDKADALGDERDAAATAWLTALQNPPDSIPRDFDNPVHQQWLRDLAGEYRDHILMIQRDRKATLEERSKNPLPEPTCGKSVG